METRIDKGVHNKRARELTNKELIGVLCQIENITKFLGEIEDVFDSAHFLGMLEQLVDLYIDGADSKPRVNEFEKL